ncbi:uncharacterized protein PGTG_04706 [Puccinia graminis f. sp. tritici CRL 75-36-700-3]|uniref:VHS domain-containing protein n=1 Tax=Puccinia graminis f. sp. tritici (strain CRL 75-36-700-3 / race SCCL) TaxID=418459 RepID=E3K3U8_PUCGT|nr:uncharacterized protein PGTG_04706 [Puccinia graminis f. sp. tritici CRL 75-36-700-3]EFP78750.1 hypothetical protein PGTG_04706 [Puccinia graminis f. sp. tritici CRL 75-36-700-3]
MGMIRSLQQHGSEVGEASIQLLFLCEDAKLSDTHGLGGSKSCTAIINLRQAIKERTGLQARSIKSLKKNIKLSSNQPIQIRAIRLTVILVLHSSDRFRLLVVKKLLDVLEELYHKSAKSLRKQPVKEIILKALAVLGYEFRHDEDLSAFTNHYNKIKPSDAPLNGIPLDESDGMFAPIPVNPTSVSPGQAHQQQQQQQQQQQPMAVYPPQSTQDGLPAPIPVMRDVREEAEIARCNARLLVEALAFTQPAEMETNEIIQEFHTKCLQSQNQLMDDIPWATEQAEHARVYYEQQAAAAAAQGRATQARNRRGGELVDAFRQYDELERLARAERELVEAKERSRTEVRGSLRPTDLLQTGDGPVAGGSSSSSSHSHSPSLNLSAAPEPRPVSHPPRDPSPPSKGYIVPDHDPSTDDEFYVSSSSAAPSRPSAPKLPPLSSRPPPSNPLDSSHDDSIVTPVEPSAKALGKMRRFSGRSGSLAAPLGLDSDHLQFDHHHITNHRPPSNH